MPPAAAPEGRLPIPYTHVGRLPGATVKQCIVALQLQRVQAPGHCCQGANLHARQVDDGSAILSRVKLLLSVTRGILGASGGRHISGCCKNMAIRYEHRGAVTNAMRRRTSLPLTDHKRTDLGVAFHVHPLFVHLSASSK